MGIFYFIYEKKLIHMIYGYARISSPRQNIERQIRNIKGAYQEAVVIQEVFPE